MLLLQISIVMLAIVVGSRLKGIGLGITGGIGLLLFSFVFKIMPASPPFNVLLIITTVVTAAGAVEAAGGISYLTYLCEKFIRKHPSYIIFIGPVISYFFTFLSGTSHITYSILPIISSASKDFGIRPSRPLSTTVIASQQAILASPISAANAVSMYLLSKQGLEIINLLKVIVPATLLGVLVSTIVVSFLNKDINVVNNDNIEVGNNSKYFHINKYRFAKRAIFIFLVGVLFVIISGIFTNIRPKSLVNGELVPLNMSYTVSITMLSVTAMIVMFCKINTYSITRGKIFLTGIEATVSILGIAWLANTLFANNIASFTSTISNYIGHSYWKFGLLLFIVNVISNSQAVTLQILLPIGISLGIPLGLLVGLLPAVNSMFFLPSYPTMLAAISFDSTGSTSSGKFLLDHSFMLPGMIATAISCIVSYLIANFIF